ncbi:dATP/dGTP pyrophosphohydrolase domain-containing protein [Klebsiella pneumoniae]
MTKSTITREQLEKWVAQFDEDGGCDATDRQLEALIRQSLSTMDSQSVAEVLSNRPGNGTSIVDVALPVGTQLYRHAQPASEREQVRREHAEWSQATFGNVGPVGPLKHLSKEALEAAAEPGDLSEWADMQFLLWDAQRRAGITDEQITQAMIEKLAVNKQRKWPEPKDGEPRLHIKEQPAPVVPDGYVMVPAEPTDEMLAAAKEWTGLTSTAEVVYTKMLEAAPHLPGSDPATVPGKWIPVSERMPEDEQEVLTINRMGRRFVSFFDKHSGLFFDRLDAPAACCIEHVLVTHWMPLPAAPQEVKGE